MKKIWKRLITMFCVLSVCLVSPGVPALASYDPNNPDVTENWEKGFYGWIDDVYYDIDKVKGEARAMEGRMEGDTFRIPSTVTWEGKEYPVISYSPSVPDYISERQPRNYKRIEFPDTMRAILLEQKYFPELESFNIPSSIDPEDMSMSGSIIAWDPHHLILKADFGKVKVEIAENHPYFIVKNHAL